MRTIPYKFESCSVGFVWGLTRINRFIQKWKLEFRQFGSCDHKVVAWKGNEDRVFAHCLGRYWEKADLQREVRLLRREPHKNDFNLQIPLNLFSQIELFRLQWDSASFQQTRSLLKVWTAAIFQVWTNWGEKNWRQNGKKSLQNHVNIIIMMLSQHCLNV